MRARSICGVILVSDDPARLAEFYGKVLGCEFECEQHGGLEEHFGVDIGDTHFGIHPPSNFRHARPAGAGASIAFDVTSLAETIAVLKELGATQVQPPHDEGFGLVASYLDVDGNTFEVVELTYNFEEQ